MRSPCAHFAAALPRPQPDAGEEETHPCRRPTTTSASVLGVIGPARPMANCYSELHRPPVMDSFALGILSRPRLAYREEAASGEATMFATR